MGVGLVTSALVTYSDNAPTVAVPGGAVAGDFFLLGIQCPPSVTLTWPIGFTEATDFSEEVNLGTLFRTALKSASGSESGDFVASMSGYGGWMAICAVVHGFNSTVGDGSGQSSYGYATSVSMTGGSVTTAGDGHLVVWVATTGAGGGQACTASVTQPSGMTLHDLQDAGNGSSICLASMVQATAGAATYSGSADFGAVSDSRDSNVITLTFAPASTPSPIALVANAVITTAATAVLTTGTPGASMAASAVIDTSATAVLTTGIRLVAHAAVTTRAHAKLLGSASPSPFVQSAFSPPIKPGPWSPTGPWFSSSN